MTARGMSGASARNCRRNSSCNGGYRVALMLEDGLEETAQDLIDLNEVMHAFGVSEWHNLGPVDAGHDGSSGLLVEIAGRSEEHTSELQSRFDLVCRLLLEK